MKIFKIAQSGGVSVKLAGDPPNTAGVTGMDRELSATKIYIKRYLEDELEKALSTYFDMSEGGISNFVIMSCSDFEEDSSSNNKVGIKLKVIPLKSFPQEYTLWLLDFIKSKTKQIGITIQNVEDSSISFGEVTYSTYALVLRVPISMINKYENQIGVSLYFPNAEAFQTLIKFTGGIWTNTGTTHQIALSRILDGIYDTKKSAELHKQTLSEYWLWVAENTNGPSKVLLENYASTMAEYAEKLETLKSKSEEYELRYLWIEV